MRAIWLSTKRNFYAEYFEVITAEAKPVFCQKKKQPKKQENLRRNNDPTAFTSKTLSKNFNVALLMGKIPVKIY
jgi:hypothetical protein